MKPSRTFTITIFALCVELIMVAVLPLIAWLAPEALSDAVGAVTILAPSVAGLGASGAGAMSYRDAATGGLTSSSGTTALAGMKSKHAAGTKDDS